MLAVAGLVTLMAGIAQGSWRGGLLASAIALPWAGLLVLTRRPSWWALIIVILPVIPAWLMLAGRIVVRLTDLRIDPRQICAYCTEPHTLALLALLLELACFLPLSAVAITAVRLVFARMRFRPMPALAIWKA